jgi:hypothetical protein
LFSLPHSTGGPKFPLTKNGFQITSSCRLKLKDGADKAGLPKTQWKWEHLKNLGSHRPDPW